MSATAMGEALRKLGIPVGDVYSSPAYRALETIRLAALGAPTIVAELGDRGQSMAPLSETEYDWLRNRVALRPRSGANTFVVTHQPNIAGAFPEAATGLADGEALVFGRGANGAATLVARIKIEDWPRLAE